MSLVPTRRRRRTSSPRSTTKRRTVRRTTTRRAAVGRRISKNKRSLTGLAALGLLLAPAAEIVFDSSVSGMSNKINRMKGFYTGVREDGSINTARLKQTYLPPLIPLGILAVGSFLFGRRRIGNIFKGLPVGA